MATLQDMVSGAYRAAYARALAKHRGEGATPAKAAHMAVADARAYAHYRARHLALYGSSPAGLTGALDGAETFAAAVESVAGVAREATDRAVREFHRSGAADA